MSAHDQMRQMLDQLMGTGRDGKYLKTVALFDYNNMKCQQLSKRGMNDVWVAIQSMVMAHSTHCFLVEWCFTTIVIIQFGPLLVLSTKV